jgi:catechol 2,3-dioxygenase-like lactoylglutathione lyase family enzyme
MFGKAGRQPKRKQNDQEQAMKTESAVQFDTNSRIHMGLAVKNLDQSVAFYRTLFGRDPTKVRKHYAKFETAEPPVNLALNEVGATIGPNHPVAHFGIQVKTTTAVTEVADRLRAAGMKLVVEDNVTCCYAVQNKVWATDPDGNKWEVYVVLDNDAAQHHSSKDACCPDLPAVMDAVQRSDMTAAKAAFEKAGGMSACACLTPTSR